MMRGLRWMCLPGRYVQGARHFLTRSRAYKTLFDTFRDGCTRASGPDDGVVVMHFEDFLEVFNHTLLLTTRARTVPRQVHVRW